MSDIQLYIDPACMLSKVPYKVPNNTHYVTLEDYARLKAENEQLRKVGNWMFNAIILNSDKDIGQAMDAWNAARGNPPLDDMDFQEQQDIRLNR